MKPSELLEQREQEVRDLGNVYPSYYHDRFGTMVILKARKTKDDRKRDQHLASGEARRMIRRNKDNPFVTLEDENDEVMGEAIALGRALKMYHKLYPAKKNIITTSGDMGYNWSVSPNTLTLR